jgi:hypothetical protein
MVRVPLLVGDTYVTIRAVAYAVYYPAPRTVYARILIPAHASSCEPSQKEPPF